MFRGRVWRSRCGELIPGEMAVDTKIQKMDWVYPRYLQGYPKVELSQISVLLNKDLSEYLQNLHCLFLLASFLD